MATAFMAISISGLLLLSGLYAYGACAVILIAYHTFLIGGPQRDLGNAFHGHLSFMAWGPSRFTASHNFNNFILWFSNNDGWVF